LTDNITSRLTKFKNKPILLTRYDIKLSNVFDLIKNTDITQLHLGSSARLEDDLENNFNQ